MTLNVDELLAEGRGRQLPRREYRDGIELSIIGFGGIVVNGQEQPSGNDEVARAVDRGVNYFDVAPAYNNGEAEIKLGIALQPYRDQSFLACKTGRRDAEGARFELERSLERLNTDHFDLYQFHAINLLEDVEKILGVGGAMETFLKARDEGMIRYIGFSAHSEEAALALLDRFPFDSVLFPINYVCYAQGKFGPGVIAKAQEIGAARLALKGLAHSPWGEGNERSNPKTWYRPIDDESIMKQALRFTLSEPITAALPPGDERLFRLAVDIGSAFVPLSPEERASLVESTWETEPIFSV